MEKKRYSIFQSSKNHDLRKLLGRNRTYFAVGVILIIVLAGVYLIFPYPSVTQNQVSTTRNGLHIGIWTFNPFNYQSNDSTVQKFYNTVFDKGIFNSMEIFAPTGMSYSNTISDTQFTDQVIELAQLAQKSDVSSAQFIFIIGMDININGSNHEFTQLQNFLTATSGYAAVYGLGINWERDTWGCDSFSRCSIATQLNNGKVSSTQVTQDVSEIESVIVGAGKQFISYYAPPISTILPPAGQLWEAIGNVGYPISLSGGNQSASSGYWTLGWFTQPNSKFNYIGISAGLFTPRPMPDPLFYVNNSGSIVSSCSLSDYNGACGPGGQWNNVTVDWFFQQESLLRSQYPFARQFLMLGGDQISGPIGSLVDPTLQPYFWNSNLFQSWVRIAESKYNMTPY